MYKFRDISKDPFEPTDPNRTVMQVFFESYLSIAANIPLLLSMILNAVYGQKFDVSKRIYVTLALMLAVFVLTTSLVVINTDSIQWSFFTITIILVVIINFASGIFQAAILGLASFFPSTNIHFLVNGQAIAGLLAVAIQIMSLLTHESPMISGFIYFSTSVFFISITMLSFWLLSRNEYAIYYIKKGNASIEEQQHQDVEQQTETHLINGRASSASSNFDLIKQKGEICDIIKENWQLFCTVIMIFWATLAVYPGICVLVAPLNQNNLLIPANFYTTITVFLLFGIGDLFGRLMAAYVPFPVEMKREILIFAVLRSLFPILIIFCNVQPKYHTSVLFKNDFAFPILNFLSSLSNGYAFSTAMVMASANSRSDRQELTSFLMSVSLGTALTLGSISSYVLLRII